MNPTSLALQLPPKSLDCLPTGEVERLTNMTVAELREQLAQSLQVTATGLMRLAVVVRILEDRGEDLSELRVPLLTYLRQIATGRLLPAVVARFAETPALVSIVGRFPLRDQAALANGDSVRLVVLGEGGKPTHRLADPTKLTPTQRGQVFARDHVRSEEEQILLLESNRSRAPVWKGGATKFGKVHVDRAAGTIRIGRSLASVEDAVKALRACGIIP